MRSIRILALVFVLAVPAAAREDWMYLSQWMVTHPVSRTATVSVLGETYRRDNFTDDFIYDTYLTLSWKAGAGFTLLTQYQAGTRESVEGGSWSAFHLAVGGVAYTTPLPGVGRLRLQERVYYRTDEPSGGDHHRQRILVERDVGPVTLSVWDETRLDLSGDRPEEFFRNRLFATATWKATSALSLGLGYFRQWDHGADGHWPAINGLQTVVTFAF